MANMRVERRSTFYPQLDQRITGRATLAWVLALQGHLDQAAEHARTSLEEAMATGYELAICHVLRLAACPVALLIGDLAAAEKAITQLVDVATRFNAPFFKSAGRCLEGKLRLSEALSLPDWPCCAWNSMSTSGPDGRPGTRNSWAF
jgi:hypothetical protein